MSMFLTVIEQQKTLLKTWKKSMNHYTFVTPTLSSSQQFLYGLHLINASSIYFVLSLFIYYVSSTSFINTPFYACE